MQASEHLKELHLIKKKTTIIYINTRFITQNLRADLEHSLPQHEKIIQEHGLVQHNCK